MTTTTKQRGSGVARRDRPWERDIQRLGAEQAGRFEQLAIAAEADADRGAAACALGEWYREGRDGLRHSPREARRWYARSALAGNASGQNNLGACFQHGFGGPQSYPQAMHWYRTSAAQRVATAAANLGYLHRLGRGALKHPACALQWFQYAVEFGDGSEATRALIEALQGEAHQAAEVWNQQPWEPRVVDMTGILPAGGMVILGARPARAPASPPKSAEVLDDVAFADRLRVLDFQRELIDSLYERQREDAVWATMLEYLAYAPAHQRQMFADAHLVEARYEFDWRAVDGAGPEERESAGGAD